jgi:hypothetical protein
LTRMYIVVFPPLYSSTLSSTLPLSR